MILNDDQWMQLRNYLETSGLSLEEMVHAIQFFQKATAYNEALTAREQAIKDQELDS